MDSGGGRRWIGVTGLCLLTRGAIRDSNAICQERPGRLLFRRCPSDGKGRYDAGDAGARYEVRDSSEQ